MSFARFLYLGKVLNMSAEETWCTPIGLMGDLWAWHLIENGAKEKRKKVYKDAIPNIP